MTICNLSFNQRSFSLLVPVFSLLSPLCLIFSAAMPFEDDNSKDVWLGLKTLKRRVARLVNGGLQVFLCFKWSRYYIFVFQTFQTRV